MIKPFFFFFFSNKNIYIYPHIHTKNEQVPFHLCTHLRHQEQNHQLKIQV
jgi:hypothetical protein